ncbi:MAG: hypothetical protein BWZ10_00862 [candidate division BRC1 bacterium ADurb.BinA364]|nr:MAG: hypothetical protein BWZ10_00862 [candidate division BRC1 bacterium ADurb.BinA364]
MVVDGDLDPRLAGAGLPRQPQRFLAQRLDGEFMRILEIEKCRRFAQALHGVAPEFVRGDASGFVNEHQAGDGADGVGHVGVGRDDRLGPEFFRRFGQKEADRRADADHGPAQFDADPIAARSAAQHVLDQGARGAGGAERVSVGFLVQLFFQQLDGQRIDGLAKHPFEQFLDADAKQPRGQPGNALGRFVVPKRQPARGVQHVGRRQRGALDGMPGFEALQRQFAKTAAQNPLRQFGERVRPLLEQAQRQALVIAEVQIAPAVAQGYDFHSLGGTGEIVGVPLQPVQRAGATAVAPRHPSHGRHPAGADGDLAALEGDQAVAAQAHGAHVQGADMRFPAADHRPFGANPHFAVLDAGGVGRRAADIDHDGVLPARQIARSGDAGRRTGQDGFDRPLDGRFDAHQRAVAAHDHHRRRDAAPAQRIAHLFEQRPQAGDDAGIERGRDGAQTVIQPLGDIVAANDRHSGFLAHDVAHLDFVRGIVVAGVAGDGEGFDLVLFHHRAGGAANLIRIDRRDFRSVDFHLSVQHGQRAIVDIARFVEPIRRQHQQADLLALAFDDGVGGQGGGERNQIDPGQMPIAQAVQRLADADREIPFGGQRLGLAQHFSAAKIVDHGVGVGAAGVDAEAQADLAAFLRRRAVGRIEN